MISLRNPRQRFFICLIFIRHFSEVNINTVHEVSQYWKRNCQWHFRDQVEEPASKLKVNNIHCVRSSVTVSQEQLMTVLT